MPFSIVKWVRDLVRNPYKKVEVLVPELLKLRSELQRIEGYFFYPNRRLDALVDLFNVVSVWHDREREIFDLVSALEEVNYGQHDVLISNLEAFRKSASDAGRCSYGWNRTEKGEVVTDDNVFLGNIYGLFTHPISRWKKGKDEPKGGWGFSGMENLNPYDVVSLQAEDFVRGVLREMVPTLYWFETAVEDSKAA